MTRSPHSSRFSDNFKVDPLSPSGLSWITKHSGVTKTIAGHTNAHGYWKVKLAGKIHHVASIILELSGNPKPSLEHSVDHINRNRSDNRLENLRWATASVQQQNKRAHGKTGWKFVTQLPNGRYRAQGYYKGERWCGGYHDSAYAAHKSACATRLELHWI